MADPKIIILDDFDIFAAGHVDKIINVVEEKTFSRDKLINSEFSLTVKNYKNFYSVDNPDSYFKDIKWRYKSLKIYNSDGDLIWDGIIRNITRDHESGTAKIITISKLHKKWNQKIIYSSSADETPATAAQNIMDTYGIDYDTASMQRSIDVLDTNSCYVRVNITEEDSVTVMAAIEKLAEFGCADAFTSFGKVFFKHWTVFAGGVKVNIKEKELKTRPFVTDTESEIINQFQIYYSGDAGTPITDTNNIGSVSKSEEYFGEHDLPGFTSAGIDSQIYYTSLVGAQYVGECYINRTHINVGTEPRAPWLINFSLKGTNENWIDLETYFTITFGAESWDKKVFELFRTEINYNDNSVKLVAIEVQV
jgi:hypothetical protein